MTLFRRLQTWLAGPTRGRTGDRRLRDAARPLVLERLESRAMLSLTHLYTFNDGLANDWVGSAHATLFNGASIVGGQLSLSNAGVTSGQSGVVQYARLPAGVLPASGSVTIEAWFTTNDSSPWARVFDVGDQSGVNGNSYLFFTPFTDVDDSRAVLRPAALPEQIASGPPLLGAEHMAAVVVDAAADTLRLYIDGAEVSTSPLAGADAASVNDALAYLGRSLFNADPGYSGLINEVRIYDEARPAPDVLAAAAAGPTTLAKSPLVRQMEYLNRGVVAVHRSTSQAYISWRLLGTDPTDIAFNLYRANGGGAPVKLNPTPLLATTDYTDTPPNFTSTNAYFVRPVLAGQELAASETYTLPANEPVRQYLNVPLQRPPGATVQMPVGVPGDPGSHDYTYNANDASVGDLDGDGQYEIVLKWDPFNPNDIDDPDNDPPRTGEGSSQDNSRSGFTGDVIIDAYKLDGTLMWRINLGRNIRAGAHYTQFLVYDFDGDGKSEVVMRTAPGTIDGQGNPVLMGSDQVAADYRNSSGYILTGPEYLTVFNGETGAAMSSVSFSPPRGSVSSWGDSYGNRVDRFLATVAYLDGVHPSIVMTRGYYAKTRLTAFDWRNGQLTERWAFDSTASGNGSYAGQGNHNLSVADVDLDGKDEIIFGAAVFNDNGQGLHTTGLGHGDAMHVSDMDPNRPGLEVWQIHESSGEPGADFRDARTGQAIFTTAINTAEGPGRGVAADVWAGNPGYEMWGAPGGLRDRFGNNIGRTPSTTNFLVWWDADPVRELLDGQSSGNGEPRIDKYGTSSDTRLLTMTGARTNNGTKATPSLSADILGDWREEVIVRVANNSALRIYTTTTPATSRLYTLMHDPQYRQAIAWQNTAYNQPPHPGFFLGAGMTAPPTPSIYLPPIGPPLPGDFNGDRRVDTLDLASWQDAFGQIGLVDPAPGDADGDLHAAASDFLAWQQNFGAPAPPALAAASSAAATHALAAESLAAADAAPHDAALEQFAAESLRALLTPRIAPLNESLANDRRAVDESLSTDRAVDDLPPTGVAPSRPRRHRLDAQHEPAPVHAPALSDSPWLAL